MTDPELEIETANDLPPSRRYVLDVLIQSEKPLSVEQVTNETYYCERTVRAALRELRDRDLVTSRIDLDDARRPIYELQR